MRPARLTIAATATAALALTACSHSNAPASSPARTSSTSARSSSPSPSASPLASGAVAQLAATPAPSASMPGSSSNAALQTKAGALTLSSYRLQPGATVQVYADTASRPAAAAAGYELRVITASFTAKAQTNADCWVLPDQDLSRCSGGDDGQQAAHTLSFRLTYGKPAASSDDGTSIDVQSTANETVIAEPTGAGGDPVITVFANNMSTTSALGSVDVVTGKTPR